MTFLFSGGKTG